MDHMIFNIVFMPLLGAIAAFFGGKFLNRLLSKLAFGKEFEEGSERRTGMYTEVHEDSSTEPTYKLPAKVEFRKKSNDRFAQIISSTLMISSAVFAIIIFQDIIFNKNIYQIHLFDWINIASFKSEWNLYIDSVTAVMLLVVTSVSAVVHLYSIGYMKEDKSIPRFMSYLSLFTFFMLLLVTSNNILQLFVGWEGVGLCSYLLIGFWHHKPSANAAAMKAFIVNRVGDFAFMLGIGALFFTFDSINFQEIFASSEALKDKMILFLGHEYRAMDLICALLFIGAMGKSAQLGLHTWLPDAMEGPTPVSALIHAATMVTAGVFLVIRFSPIFELAPSVLDLVTYIGAFTAIFAASIALVQNDIKKIIAYSTCSQLGYMFFACGVGAYPVALFHLMTHAFFKALLFLGAGNVIHSMHHEQDINKMGGLWQKIPFTYSLMLIGSLALAGIYPFAGYFSKDLILETSFAKATNAGIMAYILGTIGAFFTAFYSWRLLFIAFHGKAKNHHEVYEAPKIMTMPLIVLALGAIFSGMLAVSLGILAPDFWNNSLIFSDIIEKAHHVSDHVKLLPLFASALGIFLAYLFYIKLPELPQIFAHSFYGFYLLLANKYYIDEIYDSIFVKPFKFIANILWQIGDMKFIDGLGPNGAAYVS
ncbi:MAG: NADH-quinone oxidoreductase subunit L, partial [Pseudomonadota bacterium]